MLDFSLEHFHYNFVWKKARKMQTSVISQFLAAIYNFLMIIFIFLIIFELLLFILLFILILLANGHAVFFLIMNTRGLYLQITYHHIDQSKSICYFKFIVLLDICLVENGFVTKCEWNFINLNKVGTVLNILKIQLIQHMRALL